MSTIGLYDINFNHEKHFSISLPLMKAYGRLIKEGHQVILMKPYEETGRYNKIFYFYEGNVEIPKRLTINTEKGKMIGRGFYGYTNLVQETLDTPPDFTPYEINIDRVKNKTLFNSIKRNSLVNWDDKDFSGVRKGAGKTYIADREFMGIPDWEGVFEQFDNNISFIYTLHPTLEQLPILIKKNYTATRIVVPPIFDEKIVKKLLDTKGIIFDDKNSSLKDLIIFITFVKTFSNKRIPFCSFMYSDPTRFPLVKWSASGQQESYNDFRIKNYGFMPIDNFHFNFSPKELLYQNPQKITPDKFLEKYFKYLT